MINNYNDMIVVDIAAKNQIFNCFYVRKETQLKHCVHENNVPFKRHRSKVSLYFAERELHGGPRRFQPGRVKTVYLCINYSQMKLMGMKYRFCRH